MPSLSETFVAAERELVAAIEQTITAVDHRPGKGSEVEDIVERKLLRPYLPPNFDLAKGSVLCAENPTTASPEIDRVVYEPSVAPPFYKGTNHSVFPIESVCGTVQITAHLDRSKLRADVEAMSHVRAMTKREFLIPTEGTKTKVDLVEVESLSPRTFIVGLPGDRSWAPKTIARALHETQMDLGSPTHVHGLYVVGIGFFSTVTVEEPEEPNYGIMAWTGPERYFQFVRVYWQAWRRWHAAENLWVPNFQAYLKSEGQRLV